MSAVSVVIPAYNYAGYLPSAVASVCAQTMSDLEIVIVDDGSTDNTAEVVADMPDSRIRYIWQKNAGLSAARNTGVTESRSSQIAFLDADDLWEPQLLATALEKSRSLPSEFGLVATNSSRIDAIGQRIPPPKRTWDRDREFTVRDFCLRNRPLSSSVMVRREVFDSVGGFDVTLQSSEDRDFWIRATAAGYRFWFINEPLCRIRRHGGNMSKHARRMRNNSGRVLGNAWRRGVAPRWNLLFWGRVFAVFYQQVATTHFEAGLRARAMGYLLASVACCPFFAHPGAVYEPPFFRLRTLARFLRESSRPTLA